MGSESKRDSTYLIKNAPSDRVEAPSSSDAPESEPPDDRWRTSNPPPGESLEAKWWPDRELGKAFRRWTGIPPAGGDDARTVAMKFLIERLNVGELTAVGTAPRTPLPDIEPRTSRPASTRWWSGSGCTVQMKKRPTTAPCSRWAKRSFRSCETSFPGASGSIVGSRTCSRHGAGACPAFAEPWSRLASRPRPTSASSSGPTTPKLATTPPWSQPSCRTRFSSNRWRPPCSTTIKVSRGARCTHWRSSMNRKAWRGSRSRSALSRSRRTPTSAHACSRCVRSPFSAMKSASKRSSRALSSGASSAKRRGACCAC